VRHASRFGLAEIGGRQLNGIAATDPQPDAELGLRRARAATLLMLGLPGSAYLYQGEELGLPDHTALPAAVRQDPSFFRTDGAEPGRDGCRVPLPWVGGAPGNGFGPTDQTWLPQPDVYAGLAADQQYGVAGSTYEMYRTALDLRRAEKIGTSALSWVDALAGSPDVVAFQVAGVVVLANLGAAPVVLPAEADVLVASGDLDTSGGTTAVPSDTTVWLHA
jgi:alpha-glucosidase